MIPIKIEKAEPQNYKVIEWFIHNVCNNDCSFCSKEFKDGSQRWYSLDEYKRIVDRLVTAACNEPLWIQITGGEPTLFPELLEVLEYIKSKGVYISLISNGSRTLRWWEELRKKQVIDLLNISYHSEQTTDYQHIIEVINLFHDAPTEVICLVTHVETSIELAFEAVQYLKENTGCIIIFKAIMMHHYNIFEKYTEKQLSILNTMNTVISNLRKTKRSNDVPKEHQINHTLLVTYDNGTKLKTDPQILLKSENNKFKGWSCDFGRKFMRIEGTKSYRGVCRVGDSTDIFSDTFGFSNDFLTCTNNQCVCSTDLISTKLRPG